jgi:hypothetical protein
MSQGGQQLQMSEQRPMLLVFLVFATSLAALAVAGVSAWLRCGRGGECSSELALGILALGPACIIGILMIFLLRVRITVPWVRTVVLAVGVGIAALPLAAFLFEDIRMLPAFAALLAGAVFLVIWGEESEARVEPALAPPPAVVVAERPPRATAPRPTAVPRPSAERYLPRRRRPAAALAVLRELSTLNDAIIRHCERLALPGPAPAAPAYRTPPSR